MSANFITVTISNIHEKSIGRFKTYKVNNYGQALGIVRCCLTRWSDRLAHIQGFKTDGEFVDEHFFVEGVHVIKSDRHQAISVGEWRGTTMKTMSNLRALA